MRRFALCRICFRERALLGELPGRDQVELVDERTPT
jgi:ribosomal protein S14